MNRHKQLHCLLLYLEFKCELRVMFCFVFTLNTFFYTCFSVTFSEHAQNVNFSTNGVNLSNSRQDRFFLLQAVAQ